MTASCEKDSDYHLLFDWRSVLGHCEAAHRMEPQMHVPVGWVGESKAKRPNVQVSANCHFNRYYGSVHLSVKVTICAKFLIVSELISHLSRRYIIYYIIMSD